MQTTQRTWPERAWLAHALPLLAAGQLAAEGAERASSLRMSAGLHLFALLFTLLSLACCKLGVWNVASRLARRSGRAVHLFAAKLLVLIGAVALLTVFAIQHRATQAYEMGQIALGHDPVPVVDIEVASDGHSLTLRGTLGEGSAEAVHEALAHAPWATLVRLESGGGRVLEAEAIAREIAARQMDTHVDGLCASACTMILLAGQQRSASPGARVGFHRPNFAGVDSNQLGEGHALMVAYRNAGLGRSFIERVKRTPSSSMWYPSTGELKQQRVITTVYGLPAFVETRSASL